MRCKRGGLVGKLFRRGGMVGIEYLFRWVVGSCRGMVDFHGFFGLLIKVDELRLSRCAGISDSGLETGTSSAIWRKVVSDGRSFGSRHRRNLAGEQRSGGDGGSVVRREKVRVMGF